MEEARINRYAPKHVDDHLLEDQGGDDMQRVNLQQAQPQENYQKQEENLF